MPVSPVLRCLIVSATLLALHRGAAAQTAPAATQSPLPDAPSSPGLRHRPAHDPFQTPGKRLVMINGLPYEPPTQRILFIDYLNDSYGLPAMARSTVRTLYNFAQDQPHAWNQDFPGFAQRFGSNVGITAIDGNVRYAMEEVFHEDLRYIPCHGCSIKHKIENALLAEITARHAADGHRFFTLTPTVADFSGPILARELWYPNTTGNAFFGGIVATRTVFATRVGSHLFREFVLERLHRDPPLEPARAAPPPSPAPPVGDAGNPSGEMEAQSSATFGPGPRL
jgi:hypothetical protein